MIDVRFRGRPPAPGRAYDAALALGERLLARHRLKRCQITVNANRRRVLSWRLSGPDPRISVHWALLARTDQVIAVISGVPGAWESLREHLPAPSVPDPQPRGAVHHLQALLCTQREHLPQAPADLQITWGRWPTTPPRRSLRLGSCDPPLIRIHPVLDHSDVPGWFVGFVVYHEMLHAVHLPVLTGARRRLHTRAFRAAEAAHPDHARANQWEQAHVRPLLARCRDAVHRRRATR